MRSFSPSFFCLALLPALVFGASSPILSPHVLHESRSGIPHGWIPLPSKPSVPTIPLRFALNQPGLASLDAHLNAVSDPESPTFGEHWSASQIAAAFAPSQDSIDTVSAWIASELGSDGRARVTKAKNWIEVDVTVAEAEHLLKAEYKTYTHEETGAEHIACEKYHLPEHVQPHVDLVMPTIHFNAVHRKRSVNEPAPARTIGQPNRGPVSPKTAGSVTSIFKDLENCDKQTTPACLRALYGLIYEPLSTSKNSYGIVEYTPQTVLQEDIDKFGANFSSGLVGKFPKVVAIDGAVLQQQSKGFEFNGEADLDFQYGMALVTPRQEVTLYQVGDLVEGASFNNLLDALDGSFCTLDGGDDPTQDGIYPDPAAGGYKGAESCGIVKPANVISTSYGYDEADLSPKYTARQCQEYAKLGLMGVTVLYSSGDYGVAGNGGLCLEANGTQTKQGKIFNPAFPSTCPYVTSVGATQVNPNSSIFEPESACEQVIYSGGGFSNYFARPSYQEKAVSSFLKNHPPPYSHDLYNATGNSRAYPDLAANGANYVVSVAGNFSLVYGTSASAPVVGAILTMVNDARITIGKKPIGFINPTIYSDSFASAFNDITSGGNQGCGTAGFTATEGWDPVTGLGTPNFPKLLAKWLLLP
ncbi:hypothetical protein PLICRDRAFT_105438 [Plicaturopsis crispa FD-325 SS-3]|nr:hypothetical protein PLICRDRAFT_105438 [Plicaturopsis crispa FD-325 SS-3]